MAIKAMAFLYNILKNQPADITALFPIKNLPQKNQYRYQLHHPNFRLK
jgi:hypothetical protein